MTRFDSFSYFSILPFLACSLAGCAVEAPFEQEDPESVAEALTLQNDGLVTLVDDITVTVKPRFNVPYAGIGAAEFPQGLPLAIGSGLRLKKKQGLITTYYALTDRGPNGDAPTYRDVGGVSHSAKSFLAPDYAPQIVQIKVAPFLGAFVTSALPIKSGGATISGRPRAGFTTEAGLDESLSLLSSDAAGLDPEGIDIDADGNLWICDEYGPAIAKIHPRTGEILALVAPGAGLPNVLASRQLNRGFEGIAVAPNGKIYAVIQGTLDIAASTKSKAQFIRMVEYDPTNGATRMFAYPHDIAVYAKSGDAKLGDLIAIDDEHFLLIEQGKDKNGALRNLIYAIDIDGATDLSGLTLAGGANAGKDLEYGTAAEIAAQITVLRKSLVVDLRGYGYLDEKAEGLALYDQKTLVIANDQDFGTRAAMAGDPANTDPTAYVVDSTGALTIGGVPSLGSYEIHAAPADAQRSHLFVIRMRHPLSYYFPL